jgi:hypothetical protein
MKVISIAIVRTGSDLNDPIPLSVTNDLSTFGFFQRQVCVLFRNHDDEPLCMICAVSQKCDFTLNVMFI